MELLATVRSVTVDLHLLTLLSAFIPILTGVITKKLASKRVKSLLTTALSILAGGIGAVLKNQGNIPDVEAWVTEMVLAFVIAQATYRGLWKPTGVAEAVQNVAPDKGIGTAVLEVEPVLLTPPSPADIDAVVADLMMLGRNELVEKARELGITVPSRATKQVIARRIAEISVVKVGSGEQP